MIRWLPLLFVLACDSGPRAVAFADYTSEGMAALCSWAVRCRHAPDDATCMRLLDPRTFDRRRAGDSIRLGRLAYDPDAAGRCLQGGRDAECSAPPFLDPSCGKVFTGLVGENGVCTSPYDCAGGAACREPQCAAGCCVGTCAPPPGPVAPMPLSPVGGKCNTHDDCVDTAYCEVDGRCHEMPRRAGDHCLWGCYFGDLFCEVNSERCTLYAKIGEACGAQALCNDSYSFCDGGTCRARPGLGEACDETTRRCVGGMFCSAEGKCAARGSAGAPCSGDAQCDVACEAGTCVIYETCAP